VTVGSADPVVGVFRVPVASVAAGATRGRAGVARTVAKVTRGRARVTLRCAANGPACAGVLRLVRRTARRSTTWGSALFTIAAGRRKTISVALKPAARRSLARARNRRARVIARIEVSGRRPANTPIVLKR
jgi:hypothetical protein